MPLALRIATAEGLLSTSCAGSEMASVTTFTNGGSGARVNGNDATVAPLTSTLTAPLIAVGGTLTSTRVAVRLKIVAGARPDGAAKVTLRVAASRPLPAITARAACGAVPGVNVTAVAAVAAIEPVAKAIANANRRARRRRTDIQNLPERAEFERACHCPIEWVIAEEHADRGRPVLRRPSPTAAGNDCCELGVARSAAHTATTLCRKSIERVVGPGRRPRGPSGPTPKLRHALLARRRFPI